MRVYRKSLVWYQAAYCNRCGSDYWCKTNLERDFKPQGLCEACAQQSLDKILAFAEKAGLAQEELELLREGIAFANL